MMSHLLFLPNSKVIFPSILSFPCGSNLTNTLQLSPPKCKKNTNDGEFITISSVYDVLGVAPDCSPSQLKAAFRAKVKEFHPDVNRGGQTSDAVIRRVIQAYQTLSKYKKTEILERECLDPFDEPECEALDLFVNEALCVGKGCSYSCVERAPHAFAFSPSTQTARAISQGTIKYRSLADLRPSGHGDDYQVQLAAGQCPRSCIHFVTPSQRIILGELLESILNVPYDASAESDLLYSLIVKAKFENNRYQKPKKKPKVSADQVDWY